MQSEPAAVVPERRTEPAAAAPERRTEPAAAAPERRVVRPSRTPRDMMLSLVVLLIPVLAIVWLYRVLQGGDQPVVTDPTQAVADARGAGSFPVVEPDGLPAGWRSVTATFRRGANGAVLRLGYLTPGGDGVQVVQSDAPAETLLPEELTGAASPAGTIEISGANWQVYRARPGELALVLLRPEVTVIVIGQGGEQPLRVLAGSLHS